MRSVLWRGGARRCLRVRSDDYIVAVRCFGIRGVLLWWQHSLCVHGMRVSARAGVTVWRSARRLVRARSAWLIGYENIAKVFYKIRKIDQRWAPIGEHCFRQCGFKSRRSA